uniref:Ig-like domain-containing protein n=1 Tax=Astyanax mexicanus TaxID=7994 RepID=A0A8B9RLS1_ASTMX
MFSRTSGNVTAAVILILLADLQVKVDPNTVGQRRVKVTCSSTCSLGTNQKYIWHRNGYTQYEYTGVSVELYSNYDQGRYSCGVSGSIHRSPSVCVFGTECWGVTYSPQHVCALKGSSVDLSCSYKYPEGHTVTKTVWFVKYQAGTEPEDLREAGEYQGRVQNRQNSQNDCSIRINNPRESDTQTYRFRFYTDDPGGGYTGQPGVTLTVTDLKVKWNVKETFLTCSNTCTWTNPPTYIWYKNGQPVSNKYSNTRYIHYSHVDAGSYSCALKGFEDLRSPAVCVYNQDRCWSITYSTRSICALIGSTVEIESYYTFPDQNPEPQPAWYIKLSSQETELSPADDRVEFFSDRANVRTLRLNNLTQSDSAQYLLRIKAPYKGYTLSSAGVSLSVTDLQVEVYSDGQTVTLTCRSSCTLPNNPTYIWYKNRQSLSHCRYKSCPVLVVSGAISYSCSVEGHEIFQSPPVYPPRNTRAELVSSGEILEGDSVTLSCSSDADPPVLSYSWFNQREPAETPLTTDQNYIITNISSQNRFYYCTAHNQLGKHNSTPIHLNVLYPPRNTRAKLVSSGEIVEGDSVSLSCSSDANLPVLSYSWFNQREPAETPLSTEQNYSITSISSQHSGFYYCTACNQLGQNNSTSIHLDVLYSPRNTRAELVSSKEIVEGDSVTLSCSSDADPPVLSYSWFNQREPAETPLSTDQNYSITNISSQHSGFYYCTAHNQLGQHSSTPIHLNVLSENSFGSYKSIAASAVNYAASGVAVVLLLVFIAVFLRIR